MIFLVEGVKGTRATEIRRRCGLTLAECEMKLGKYPRAVARCSEVIEEAAVEVHDFDPTNNKSKNNTKRSKSLLRSLALAHYRRAICLKQLNKLSLAMIDLRAALKYQPDDNNILEEIVDTHFKDATIDTEEDAVLNELYDFVEDCQVAQPRIRLTSEVITKISEEKPDFSKRPLSGEVSTSLYPDFGSPLSGFGGLGDLVGKGGLGGLAGLAGLGGSDLKSMGNMIQMISGIDGGTVNKAIEIITAVNQVVTKVKKVWNFLDKNKISIIAVGSTLWILYTLLKYSHFTLK